MVIYAAHHCRHDVGANYHSSRISSFEGECEEAMSGDVMMIISGTVVLIALFLILSTNNGQAFQTVFGSIGQQFTNAVFTLQGRSK